jgi:predicted transglutaminase-like cysteine proteinase
MAAALHCAVGFPAPALAGPVSETAALFAPVGDEASAPRGWTDFCRRYGSAECSMGITASHDLVLTPAIWGEISAVNELVNENVQPESDENHWGVDEQWDYPTDGYGDCEDYALLKRRLLMFLGIPRSALLMTVVWDQNHDGHAVLTVRTNEGDFVLDSQTSDVLLWNKTAYGFVKRQSQSDPNVWVHIDGKSTKQPDLVASSPAPSDTPGQ